MNAATAGRLLALNHDFYERFGASFSATRQRLQPGVQRMLHTLQGDESILDLGCGNGELARALAERGHRGPYLGLDYSTALLREAAPQPGNFSPKFSQVDITDDNWPLVTGYWSLVSAFAVLHHIPGEELRLKILKKVSGLLAEDGRFILSNWQFLSSERLKARIQPWSAAALSEDDVDEGDRLLDWRDGGSGLRYVHQFSAEELSGLAERAGLRVRESFLSDGEEKNLGLYQIWEKAD